MLHSIFHDSVRTESSDDRGEKQQHSPWSAPRDRRKRGKHNPSPLTISEEFEYTSPPKRRSGAEMVSLGAC